LDRTLSKASKKAKATSTEITGGTGFTYEDTVVTYYLAALLREERAALQEGIVKSVAVQQSGHDHPALDHRMRIGLAQGRDAQPTGAATHTAKQ
jgi:hypothetical protein